MSSVNWPEILASNKSEVVSFAEGSLSFKKFKRVVRGDARRELNKLERLHQANNRRVLARRACNRRSIPLAVVSA